MGNKMLAGWSKPAKIAFGIFIGLLILLAIFQSMHVDKRAEQRFERFYNSSLEGRISCQPEGSVAGSKFCIENQKFYFHPYTSELNRNKIFEYLAESGDSIYKPAYSDTLILIKEGKEYRYTFAKIE
ncbi:MAG: hypothetical protein MJA30_19935 [Cytophagales bacterium]|nr:hypothetical protein [Cytophagales bacterium]